MIGHNIYEKRELNKLRYFETAGYQGGKVSIHYERSLVQIQARFDNFRLTNVPVSATFGR